MQALDKTQEDVYGALSLPVLSCRIAYTLGKDTHHASVSSLAYASTYLIYKNSFYSHTFVLSHHPFISPMFSIPLSQQLSLIPTLLPVPLLAIAAVIFPANINRFIVFTAHRTTCSQINRPPFRTAFDNIILTPYIAISMS